MSLSTLYAHRTPFALATSSSSATTLACSFGSPPLPPPLLPPPPPPSCSASLSSPSSSSASSPDAAAMASPTTVYSDRQSLPRQPVPSSQLSQPHRAQCLPPYEQDLVGHHHAQQYNEQYIVYQHHQARHDHPHTHPLPRLYEPVPPPPPPPSGILADMVPARPKGAVRYPPFEDEQDPVTRRAVQTFRIRPFGNIQEYCRHIPYMSNKKTFFEKTRREGFEVFQYVFKLPGQEKEYHVMWDYNVGLVRMTPFFRCCNYGKTAPGKMLNDNPGLRGITHSITGGAIVAQGYWMPYHCARAMCATFCYKVAGALVPLFGPDFPAQCIPPHAKDYERKIIDPALIAEATRSADHMRRVALAEDGEGGGSSDRSSRTRTDAQPMQHLLHPDGRLFAMPPPQQQQQQLSFRPPMRPLPLLPAPVPVPAHSPVVAPSVSPDYSVPPPRGLAAAASSSTNGTPFPSPVEQPERLPSVAYIDSLPRLSPARPLAQPLWHAAEPLPGPQHYDSDVLPVPHVRDPLPPLAGRGGGEREEEPYRGDEEAAATATAWYDGHPSFAYGGHSHPRLLADSYPSPPQPLPVAVPAHDEEERTLCSYRHGHGHDHSHSHSHRKHRRDSDSSSSSDNDSDSGGHHQHHHHHHHHHHRKRPSRTILRSRNHSHAQPPPRAPASPLPSSRPSGSERARLPLAAPASTRLSRWTPTPPPPAAAAATSRHHHRSRPAGDGNTDTDAAALLVSFSARVHGRSHSGGGGGGADGEAVVDDVDDGDRANTEDSDMRTGRPRGGAQPAAAVTGHRAQWANRIESLLCQEEEE